MKTFAKICYILCIILAIFEIVCVSIPIKGFETISVGQHIVWVSLYIAFVIGYCVSYHYLIKSDEDYNELYSKYIQAKLDYDRLEKKSFEILDHCKKVNKQNEELLKLVKEKSIREFNDRIRIIFKR